MANPEKLKTRLDNVKKALEDAKNNQYDAELALLDAQISQANKHSQRAKEITENKGFGIAKESRAKKNIEKSEVELKNVEDKLSELENKAGVKKDPEVSAETQALADKYTSPDADGYVVEKATGKKVLATSVLDKEMKNQGQVVDAGGGVMGRAKDGIVNGLGYKEGNANNMLQLGKYAAIAGLVYLRWTKTNGVFEKAAYGLLAYGLLSPCGADLWNIAMNGKSNALNGKGLMAGGAFGGGGAGGEVGSVAQAEVAKNIYLSEYNKLHNPNYAFGMPLYSIFKDQKDILTYVDSANGDFDFAKLLADYNNADGILKGKLNANILDAEDPQMATTEMFMKFLTGKLTKDGVMLIDPELATAQAALNKNRSEYLKSIGLTAVESNPTLVKSKLDAKKKEIEDLKNKADFAILAGSGYKVIPGKEDQVKIVIKSLAGKNAKIIIKSLTDNKLIEVDGDAIDSDAKMLSGDKAIKNLNQIEYGTAKGANAIVLAKMEIEKADGIDIDIYNDGGKMYIQTNGNRTELVIMDGQVLRLGDPFNSNLKGNLKRMINIGIAACYAKSYLGLLQNTVTKTKDKDGNEVVTVVKEYFIPRSGKVSKLGGIEIEKSGINSGVLGTWGDDPINMATTFLDGNHAHTSNEEDKWFAASLNIIYKDRRTAGKTTQSEHLAANISVDPSKTNPTVNDAIDPGKDIKDMDLEYNEGSLRLQIKETLATIGGIGKDVVGGMYDGISGGMNQIQKDFRRWLSTEGKNWFELGEDALVRVGKDILKGIKYLGKRTLETMKSAAKWAVDTIFHGLGYTYDEVIELMQKNKLLAICVGALFGFGVAGLLGAGTIGATAIGGSIGAIIALASSQLSTPVTHPR